MHHCKKRITAKGRTSFRTLALAIAIAACLPTYAAAAEPGTTREAVIDFDIPAGDLSVALERFSTQSGIQAMYRQDLVAGKRAPMVKGSYSPSAALSRLLGGTGLSSERVNDKTYVLRAAPVQAKAARKSATNGNAAADADGAEEETKELETMVVVGSRLGTSPVESAMPIRIISREQIDRSGAGNIAQILSYLSEVSVNNGGDRSIGALSGVATEGSSNSSTVQMRGLPRGMTLILINGRRAGDSASFSETGQFDLSTIPLSLVERIEVLPAGSSAIYGGDGLAGVVNIVLRKDASGLEFRVRRSVADSYAADQVGVMWGKTWDRADLSISANWGINDSLLSSERSLTADQDYRRFGGRDMRSFGYPATVYSLAGCPADDFCLIPVAQRGNLPGLNAPVATVPEGLDGRNLQPGDFLATQGLANRSSRNYHFRSAEKTRALMVNGRVSLTETTDLFAEFTYSKREVPSYEVPLFYTSGQYGGVDSVVPASHPFNPFGADVGVNLIFYKTGIYSDYTQNHNRGVLGLRGRTGRFEWEVSGWQARDRSGTNRPAGFDFDGLTEALSSTNPATTINPFVGDGSLPASPEFLESLLMTYGNSAKSTTSGLTGYVRGRVLTLPSGEITGLAGFEGQRSSIDTYRPDAISVYVDGSSNSRALFAEARIPLLAAREGQKWERVVLTAAGRREWSDRSEQPANTETLGFEFRPFESLLLRGTYSTAFRPLLTFRSLEEPANSLLYVEDPKFNNEGYYVNVTSQGGVPPGIRPETSKNRTIGLVYRPSQDWTFSLNAWDIQIKDRIAVLALQTLVNEESNYPDRVQRNPQTGLISNIDNRNVNIALSSVSGVDVALDGYWETRVGDFQTSLAATYTRKHEQQNTPLSVPTDSLAVYNATGWAPKWKIVPRISWDNRDWLTAMIAGRYVSSYRDSVALSTGPNARTFQMLGDFWLVDLNFELKPGKLLSNDSFLSETRLTIGAANILNKLPEFCAACGNRGYDGSQYDINGRTIYAELRLSY